MWPGGDVGWLGRSTDLSVGAEVSCGGQTLRGVAGKLLVNYIGQSSA